MAACKAHCTGEMIRENLYNLSFLLGNSIFHWRAAAKTIANLCTTHLLNCKEQSSGAGTFLWKGLVAKAWTCPNDIAVFLQFYFNNR